MHGVAKLAPGPGNVAYVERPDREPPPGYVALDVRATGVCGTDLHIEAAEYPSVPPVTMGHEVCGVVAALGEGVDDGWLGRRVVSETFYSSCGACALCRDGRPNLCPERRSIGTHVDGAFAPRVIVRAGGLYDVPEGLGATEAALSEPLGCVCQALLDPPTVDAGDRVLVIGPGAIGLLAAQVVRAMGGQVTVQGAPRDAKRLALAAELGFATRVAGDDPLAPLDVVVECSGSEPGIAEALQVVRRGGRLVQIGLRGAPVTVDWDRICFSEIVVSGGLATTPRSWRRAMTLLRSGAVAVGPIVGAGDVLPFARWEEAFAMSRRGETVKAVLVP